MSASRRWASTTVPTSEVREGDRIPARAGTAITVVTIVAQDGYTLVFRDAAGVQYRLIGPTVTVERAR